MLHSLPFPNLKKKENQLPKSTKALLCYETNRLLCSSWRVKRFITHLFFLEKKKLKKIKQSSFSILPSTIRGKKILKRHIFIYMLTRINILQIILIREIFLCKYFLISKFFKELFLFFIIRQHFVPLNTQVKEKRKK